MGMTESFLARGDLTAPRVESELFLDPTSATAEWMWTAFEAPLAAWRLHALAARLSGGAQHRSRARAIILLPSAPIAEIFDHIRHMDD